MKNIFFIAISIITANDLLAQYFPCVWTGPVTGGDWQNISNWSCAQIPSAEMEVSLSASYGGSETAIYYNIPSSSIAGLEISGKAHLRAENPGASLTILNTSFTFVDDLTLDGTSPLTIILAPGVVGATFNTTFRAGQAAHRLIVSSPNSFYFFDALVTTTHGFTGNLFGTDNANSVIFEEGAIYSAKYGSSPCGNFSDISVCNFKPGSTYRIDTVGFNHNFTNKNYENIIVDAQGLNHVYSVGTTMSPGTTIIKSLTILAGAFGFWNNGTVMIGGDLIFGSNAALIIGHSSAAPNGVLNVNLTSLNPEIKLVPGAYSDYYAIELHNAPGGTTNFNFPSGSSTLLQWYLYAGNSGSTFRVNPGAELRFPSNNDEYYIDGPGNFVLDSNAILRISSAKGIMNNDAEGAIQTAERSFNTWANYYYIRNLPGIQQVGDGLPDTIRRTVHIDLGVNSTIFLNKSLNVQGTLSLSSAKVVLGNHNLTILNGGVFPHGGPTSYVITNGTGSLTRYFSGVGTAQFQVGYDENSFDYVHFYSTTGIGDYYSVRVSDLPLNTPNSEVLVQRAWYISEGTPGGSNIRLTLNYSSNALLGAFYDPNEHVFVGQLNNSDWSEIQASFILSNRSATVSDIQAFNVFTVGNSQLLWYNTFYADADGDTFGDAGSMTLACCTAPSGFVANDDDCDDANANVNPAATEICNLIDDNCDGSIDEGTQSTFYADTDGDTYGDAGSTTQACTAPSGFVANDDDCDDANANVNPAATEICNGIDDNCDCSIDEGTQSTFYADTDGDTYGDAASTTQACTAPSGFVANDDDCDDSNANVNPAATEICNLIDDDCDGNIDEETIPPTAVCKNATAILDANGMAMLLPASVNGGSSDNCTPPGGLSLAALPNVFGCADAGVQAVTLTATDDAGNTASCVATVTVLDVLHYMQEAQRTASDGLANDNLGWGAGLDGQVLIAGAPNDKVGTQSKQGSAYVFSQNQGGADNWGQLKQIKASDGAAVDYFGNSIAIADGIALVAAHGDNVGTITDAGSVYIFEKDLGGLSNWGQRTSLVASDATAYDYFGSAASLENGRAIIGAPKKKIGANNAQGAAYIHEKDAGGPDNWGNLKKIIASDGAANNFFGQSVAQSDGLVLVGANGHSNNRGAAYLFSKDLGGTDNWGQAQKLTASDAVVGDGFGTSVSMSSTVALIGAPSQAAYKGTAYIFKNSGGTWAEAKKLTASDGAANDRFGTAVAVSGDYAYVAALRASGNAGAVYVFHKDAGGTDKWGQIGKYAPAAGEAGDQFGCSLAVSGERMVLGANMDDVDGKANQGSVYVFKGEDCPDLPRPASTPTIARSASALTDVRCRPNPFSDELTVEIGNPQVGNWQIRVMDAAGRPVAEASLPAGQATWKWQSQPAASGLYFVQIRSSDGVWVLPVTLVR